jgi:NADH-quinone oxidoreductase subunit H
LRLADYIINAYQWVLDWWIEMGWDPFWLSVIKYLLEVTMVVAGILLVVLFLNWWERKTAGHFQSRLGPMRTGGWHGWSQAVADAIKILTKEDIVPAKADRWVFNLAPYLIFLPPMLTLLVIPFGDGLLVKDLNIGILYIFAVGEIGVVSILMAGWASNNKYSLLGALRTVSQMVSYELPLVLSIVGVIMLAGTMSMGGIVSAQSNLWFVVLQPVGFVIFLISATAEVNRVPFDLPEAEQELVAGYNVEYSGMKFAMFFLAEFASAFVISAVAVTLFLGGWQGPLLPSWVWFPLKTFAVVFILMWFRWTFPRFRVDQVMDLGWKVLLPLSFINILFTGLAMIYI